MIYLIILVLSLFFSFLATKSKRKLVKKFFYIITFLILFIPHAFRYGIGTDYLPIYVPYFYMINSGVAAFDEILFNLINIIAYKINGNYVTMFAISSFIFFFCIMYRILKNSSNKVLSIMLIFLTQCYFYSMNMVRQSIAISLIFFGYSFLKDKKKILFIITCLFASLFHSSALVAIILIFINDKNHKSKFYITIIIAISVLSFGFGGFVSKLIMQFSGYGWYYDSRYSTNTVSTILILTNIIYFVLSIIFINEKSDRESRLLKNINFINIILLILSPNLVLVSRIVRYFSIFQLLFIPKLFQNIKIGKNKLLITSVCISFMFVTTIYQIFILGGEQVYPYTSIWTK